MEHDQSSDRIAKLAQLRAQGQAYPNDFKREHLAQDLHDEYQEKDAAFLNHIL